MKRSNRLIVGLAAAAITFGSLNAFLGMDHWHHRHKRWHDHDGYHHHHDDALKDEQTPEELGS